MEGGIGMSEKKKKKSIKEYYAGMGLDPDKASNTGNWSGGSFNGDMFPSFIKKGKKLVSDVVSKVVKTTKKETPSKGGSKGKGSSQPVRKP